jgi:hypothetical protein
LASAGADEEAVRLAMCSVGAVPPGSDIDDVQLELGRSLFGTGADVARRGGFLDAVAYFRLAAALFRPLTVRSGDAALAGLSAALHNIGAQLAQLERWQEALVPGAEAIDIRLRRDREVVVSKLATWLDPYSTMDRRWALSVAISKR